MNKKELLAPWLHLTPGDQVAGDVCPFCNGGDSKEGSFSVFRTNDGKLVYKCHRATCNRGGAISSDGSSLLHVTGKTKVHKEFTDSTEPLHANHIKYFLSKYGFEEKEITDAGFLWVPERKAVYHPVRGPDGVFRGQVVRRYQDKQIWTYKAFSDDRRPLIAWYPGPQGFEQNHVVIVEDILSALKFSRFHNAVALLGTSFSDGAVLEIMQWSGRQYLALDNNATAKAVAAALRWSQLLDIRVIECKLDPKYWENEQLKELSEKATPF
jgi:hypothetical protein